MSILSNLKERFTRSRKTGEAPPRPPHADRDLFVASQGFADMRAAYADAPDRLYTELLAMDAEVMQGREENASQSVTEAASYWWGVVYDEPMNEVNVERRLVRAAAEQETGDAERADRLA